MVVRGAMTSLRLLKPVPDAMPRGEGPTAPPGGSRSWTWSRDWALTWGMAASQVFEDALELLMELGTWLRLRRGSRLRLLEIEADAALRIRDEQPLQETLPRRWTGRRRCSPSS